MSGITAVGATTITYTTAGSTLGVATVVAAGHCRNLQSYSGTLPKALLNNPIPNPCYITGTFATTTTALPMCNFKVRSAANVTYIKASSTTVPSCSVAPIDCNYHGRHGIGNGDADHDQISMEYLRECERGSWHDHFQAQRNPSLFQTRQGRHQPTSRCRMIFHRF